MVKYILKRLGASLLILLGVSLILYALLRCMPTDYVEQKILALTTGGVEVQEDMKKKLYEAYGLDGTILQGYWKWLTNIASFDFGTSFISGREVLSEIFSADRLGTSFVVAVIATVFEFLIAIPLGITAATHQYSIRDYVVTFFVMIGISLPSFFFARILQALLAEPNGPFKFAGQENAGTSLTGFAGLIDSLQYLILPIITMVILSIGGRMRMTRTNMLEVLNADYIRTARAKGLKERVVIYKHAFRNTMIPLATSLAGLLPGLFSGAMIIETVFDIDGIGKTALELMNKGDIPFIMGYNMFLAMLSVIGVLLADLMYALVDPRVKLE